MTHSDVSGKQRRPHVNDYDLVETMARAQTNGNCLQRARFVERCKTIWEDEKRTTQQEKAKEEKEVGKQIEWDMRNLVEMFPCLEKGFLRGIYTDHNGDMAKIVEEMLGLQMAMEGEGEAKHTENSGASSAIPAAAPSTNEDTVVQAGETPETQEGEDLEDSIVEGDCDDHVLGECSPEKNKTNEDHIVFDQNDERRWPVLTDQEGWQVCSTVKLDDANTTKTEKNDAVSWSQMANKAKDLPTPVFTGAAKQQSLSVSSKKQPSVAPQTTSEPQRFAAPHDEQRDAFDDYDFQKRRGKKKFGKRQDARNGEAVSDGAPSERASVNSPLAAGHPEE